MKCEICKERIVTQRELLTISFYTDLENKNSKAYLSFISVCKKCSSEHIDYDQETIDAILESLDEAIEQGAVVSDNWNRNSIVPV